ncbi:unnamed protein product [Caenorhabditis auriculariae]|uniref:Uncharacterized protein n=1 Tax=Caenorhabditis auriculariae TaxID=2777116 RepID=A0A8S1GS91_9PELO|nr:unnamed protein product [Caenorhabditis auriculariae]
MQSLKVVFILGIAVLASARPVEDNNDVSLDSDEVEMLGDALAEASDLKPKRKDPVVVVIEDVVDDKETGSEETEVQELIEEADKLEAEQDKKNKRNKRNADRCPKVVSPKKGTTPRLAWI